METFDQIILYSYPVLITFGLVGNITSFIIYSREKFRNTGTSTYFAVLVFSHSIALLFGCLPMFLVRMYSIDLKNFNPIFCVLFNQAYYVPGAVSGWILVLITLDRFASIFLLGKFIFKKKLSFQISALLGIVTYNFIYYGQLFFSHLDVIDTYDNLTNTNYTSYLCSIPELYILGWIDLLNSTIAPFLLMLVLTSIMIRKIFNSRKRVSSRNNTHREKDITFAVTSIFLNIFFFITIFPICLLILFQNYTTIDYLLSILLQDITNLIYYTNYSLMFIINVLTNSIFKKELKKLVKNALEGCHLWH